MDKDQKKKDRLHAKRSKQINKSNFRGGFVEEIREMGGFQLTHTNFYQATEVLHLVQL